MANLTDFPYKICQICHFAILADFLADLVNSPNIKKLNIYNKETSNCDIDPNNLNEHFLNITSQAPELNQNCDILTFSSHSNYISHYLFNFEPVCEYDVLRCVNKIQSNAVGIDEIPIRFIKIILPYILPYLTHLINEILTTSIFPQMWKIGIVVPIPKKNNPTEKEDYRPITILPCLAKVAEMLIAEQISCHINNFNLLSPLQSGFRAGHSCGTSIVKILDDIRVAFDCGKITILCLLDFSKAFDCVDHKILVAKLKYYFGFSDSAANLIASYLSNRMQSVKCNGVSSSLKIISSGVPQGSVLGPLLFSMFINDVFNCTHDAIMHAYADDVQLYLSNRMGLIEDLQFQFIK